MKPNAIESWQLKQLQSLSLKAKIERSKRKIEEWYYKWDGDVYVSVSGRDSAVLLDIVRDVCPSVVAVYCDTGLEYPEVRDFIKTLDNTIWLKPKWNFKDVIIQYGYPVVSKETSQKINEVRNTKSEKLRNHRMNGADNKFKSGKIPEKWKYLIDAPFGISDRCCEIMKKRPFKAFEKESGMKPFVGTMVADSKFRQQSYMKYSCNAFGLQRPRSAPLSIWTHEDVCEYVRIKDLTIPECYHMGYEHTGCMFCMFGVHLEKGENRFQRMARTHPAQYKYCMEKLGLKEVLDAIGVNYKPAWVEKQEEFDFKNS